MLLVAASPASAAGALPLPPFPPPVPARPSGAPALPIVHAPVRAAGPTSARPPGDAAASAAATPADVGSVTGLPLPRFAALRSNEVDLRAGPGFRYPIRWVYRRLGMPVEIEREFGVWREVLMPDGTRGWMHEATLNGRRDGIVVGGRHTMRRAAAATAGAVAIVEPGVILRILRCDAGAAWCRVAAASFRGWLPRADFWGTFPGEKVVGH
ncbi:MAG: hypothetical protein HIU82_18005 [Proteobacteria bacterium]|nr:hypothetical protein [Pseudomonadota bacterium]